MTKNMRTARLGGLMVGEGFPVRIMAAINVSPESFYKGSVVTAPEELAKRAITAIERGAEIIDVGAMSTAPYLSTEIGEDTEKSRIKVSLDAVSGIGRPISVDTVRASVAELALKNGATIVNDVSGLKNDERMAGVVRDFGASLIAMAHSRRPTRGTPLRQVAGALRETLELAEMSQIPYDNLVLDPGIGFFREEGAGRAYSPQSELPWHEWDATVIRRLSELDDLGRPLCIGLSRKSFIGQIIGLRDANERLSGSLAATSIAVMNGADVIRTHDVPETVQAVRVAEAIFGRNPRAGLVS